MSQAVYSYSDPALGFAAVTPSDSTNFTKTTRGLFVGTGGNVAAVDEQGNAVTFSNVPSGTVLPIRCIRVNSTNTTASNIVRLW